MEPLSMALLGGGLLAGGGILGGFGARSRRRALNALAQQAKKEYRELSTEYQGMFEPILDQYTRERTANMDLYRSEMRRAEQSFSQYFDQARQQYGEGMDRALGEMRIGRESSIEATRQETRRQQAAATSRNAFTGLGQTSFGSQRVEGIGSRGALQEGMIREQYAGQLSSLEASRAQGLSTLSAQMGQGLSGIQQSMATNLSNIYQTYSGNIANMQQGALTNRMNLIQQGYNIGFQNQGQAANLAGAMTSAFGSAMGSFGGAMFGAGLAGMMSPAAGALGSAGMGAATAGGTYSGVGPPPSNYGNPGSPQYNMSGGGTWA
jgi:hypothetical protein